MSVRKERFREDMANAGLIVRDYRGRNFYDGPAVVIQREELQEAIRATTLRLQWDDMGKGLVVYPAGT